MLSPVPLPTATTDSFKIPCGLAVKIIPEKSASIIFCTIAQTFIFAGSILFILQYSAKPALSGTEQTRFTASPIPFKGTFNSVRNCPAKEAFFPSSEEAEERTETRPEPSKKV